MGMECWEHKSLQPLQSLLTRRKGKVNNELIDLDLIRGRTAVHSTMKTSALK